MPERIMVLDMIFAYFSALALYTIWSGCFAYRSVYLLTRYNILFPFDRVGFRRSMTETL